MRLTAVDSPAGGLYLLNMRSTILLALSGALFLACEEGGPDTGPSDAGFQDLGPKDAGAADTGALDAGRDLGVADGGAPDLGTPDAGQSCPRSGPPAETDPPVVEIVFPRQAALLEGGDTIISGTTTDASAICSVTINGVMAQTDDDFSTWWVTLELPEDFDGTLTAIAQDEWGAQGSAVSPSLISKPFLPSGPIGLTIAQASGTRYAVSTDNGRSGTLYKMDLQSGEVTRVLPSTSRFFAQRVSPSLQPERFLAVGVDEETGAAEVLDVEVSSGTFTRLWSNTDGLRLKSVTARDDGSLIGMSEQGPEVLLLGMNGASTIISSSDPAAMVGAGPLLNNVQDIHWDAPRARLLVGDRVPSAGRLIAVDVMTGDRTLLAEASPLGFSGFALDAAGGRAYFTAINRVALVEIDLTTLGVTEISSESVGAGLSPVSVLGLGVDSAAGLAYVPAKDEQAFYSIDLVDGTRTRLDPIGRGTGPRPGQYSSYYIDDTNGQLITTDTRRNGRVFSVDTVSGDRTVLVEPGDARVRNLSHLTLLNGLWYAVDANQSAVVLIDSTSGAITPISSASGDFGVVGSGPPIGVSPVMTADEGGAVLWLAATGRVVEVTIATGARRLVSADGAGSGPLHGFPGGALKLPGTSNLLVSDPQNQRVLQIDTATGDRVALRESGALLGAQGLHLAPSGRVFVAVSRRIVAFDPGQSKGIERWTMTTLPLLFASDLDVGEDERFVRFLSVPSNAVAELDTVTGAVVVLSY